MRTYLDVLRQQWSVHSDLRQRAGLRAASRVSEAEIEGLIHAQTAPGVLRFGDEIVVVIEVKVKGRDPQHLAVGLGARLDDPGQHQTGAW